MVLVIVCVIVLMIFMTAVNYVLWFLPRNAEMPNTHDNMITTCTILLFHNSTVYVRFRTLTCNR